MRFSSLHCHTTFSDGKASAEEMVRAAVAKGFDAIGFSDHGPITVDCACNMRAEDFAAYRDEVRRLQTLFRGQIDVLFGLECDWLKGIQPMSFYDAFETDYRIGSVHFLCFDGEAAAVDFSAESQERMVMSQFNGDWEAFVLDYYRNVEAMTAAGGFEILGHLDLVRKFNEGGRLYDEKAAAFNTAVARILEAAADNRIAVEVNTGAVGRGWRSSPYPAFWILKECRRRHLPVVLNSDAHTPDGLDAFYPQALDLLREAGYDGEPTGLLRLFKR